MKELKGELGRWGGREHWMPTVSHGTLIPARGPQVQPQRIGSRHPFPSSTAESPFLLLLGGGSYQLCHALMSHNTTKPQQLQQRTLAFHSPAQCRWPRPGRSDLGYEHSSWGKGAGEGMGLTDLSWVGPLLCSMSSRNPRDSQACSSNDSPHASSVL